MNKELLKGSTGTLVLTLLSKKDMYGYELIRELEHSSKGTFSLKEGTLYPILHGMESELWVESYWQDSSGRKRKYYSITQEGLSQLQEKTKEWTVFKNAVDLVIGKGGSNEYS